MKYFTLLAITAALFVACNESKEKPKPLTQEPVASENKAEPLKKVSAINVQSIDWETAIKMQKSGAIFIDVRSPSELSQGFAPYAVNIPLNELKHRISELPKDKDLLIYCRSGRRSEIATKFLSDNGYTRAYNVLGGFLAFPQK